MVDYTPPNGKVDVNNVPVHLGQLWGVVKQYTDARVEVTSTAPTDGAVTTKPQGTLIVVV